MSYLRGNFRKKATDLSYDAIARPVANWIVGSAIVENDRQFGGFLIASFASGLSGAGFLAVSAFDLFSSTYGATLASNLLLGGSGGSSPQLGMKPVIFKVQDYSGDAASGIVWYRPSVTGALAGDDSVFVLVGMAFTGSTAAVAAASNISVHILMQGWIVSVPFAYK